MILVNSWNSCNLWDSSLHNPTAHGDLKINTSRRPHPRLKYDYVCVVRSTVQWCNQYFLSNGVQSVHTTPSNYKILMIILYPLPALYFVECLDCAAHYAHMNYLKRSAKKNQDWVARKDFSLNCRPHHHTNTIILGLGWVGLLILMSPWAVGLCKLESHELQE